MTLLVAAGIVLLSLGGLTLQYRLTAASLQNRQAELLAADLESFAAIYEQRRIPALREAVEFRAQVTSPNTAIYLLQDRNGKVLAGNVLSWPKGVKASGEGFALDPIQDYAIARPAVTGQPAATVKYRGVARTLPGGFPFIAARSETPTQTTLAELRDLIWQVGLVLIALSLLAGWLVSRAVLGRINRLNDLATKVTEGDLSARLPGPRSSDEFGALESHMHTMLDRIESLDRARNRLADTIAHELRTPLNRIRQRISRLKTTAPGDAPPPDQDDEIARIDADIGSAIRIFDSLLDISSAEAASGQRPGLVPVNLSDLTAEVFDLYEPLAEDNALTFHANIQPDCMILGERNLAAQLMTNLIDNAIKYCNPGDSITLTLTHQDACHHFVLADTGPGVPDDIRDQAFEIFTRAERDADKAGHGLGLALVQAIATRHGAKLSLPNVEKGFRIEIAWPILAPA